MHYMLRVVTSVNLYCNISCKPYLLYGVDVINWNNYDLSSITHAFNSTLCKVYKVKFKLLDSIYDFTNQCDIVHDIALRRGRYKHKLLPSNNLVIRNLLAIS